jgi:hypothetical protein
MVPLGLTRLVDCRQSLSFLLLVVVPVAASLSYLVPAVAVVVVILRATFS